PPEESGEWCGVRGSGAGRRARTGKVPVPGEAEPRWQRCWAVPLGRVVCMGKYINLLLAARSDTMRRNRNPAEVSAVATAPHLGRDCPYSRCEPSEPAGVSSMTDKGRILSQPIPWPPIASGC